MNLIRNQLISILLSIVGCGSACWWTILSVFVWLVIAWSKISIWIATSVISIVWCWLWGWKYWRVITWESWFLERLSSWMRVIDIIIIATSRRILIIVRLWFGRSWGKMYHSLSIFYIRSVGIVTSVWTTTIWMIFMMLLTTILSWLRILSILLTTRVSILRWSRRWWSNSIWINSRSSCSSLGMLLTTSNVDGSWGVFARFWHGHGAWVFGAWVAGVWSVGV